jgi:hypothetical protein
MKYFTPKLDDQNVNKTFRIPLLEDVFKMCPDMHFNIDLKADDDRLISLLNDLILKYDKEEHIVWGSFRESTVTKCQLLNPNVDSFFSLLGIVKVLSLTYTGLLPFVSLKANHFEILYADAYLRNTELPWYLYFFIRLAKM